MDPHFISYKSKAESIKQYSQRRSVSIFQVFKTCPVATGLISMYALMATSVRASYEEIEVELRADIED
jgi:hypothetical protein